MNIKSILIAVSAATILAESPHLAAQDATPTAAPSAAAEASPAASAPVDRAAEFRQRMNDRIKTMLKASDDEWAVIQPLLERVQTAERATLMGRFGGLGGFGGGRRGGFGGGGFGGGGNSGNGGGGGGNPGGPGAGSSPRPNRFSSPEADALRTALESDSTSNDDIKTKLQALRDARKKQAADLDQAREDLKKVLTLRQEAVLVEMGALD